MTPPKIDNKKHLLSPTATSTGDVGDFGDLPNWWINSCDAKTLKVLGVEPYQKLDFSAKLYFTRVMTKTLKV